MKGRKVMGLFGSPNVRKMEAKRNVEGLIKVLRSRGDIGVRKEVAGALGRIGDARAVEPLIKALQHFAYDVRKAAASALGQIGDTRAVEPLIAALNDEDRDVRSPAARALGQIGDTRAVEPLIAALNDDKSGWSVRTAAVDALERFGEARAFEALIATLKDSDWSVREAAVKALVKIGTPAVEPLVAALKDWRVRAGAAEALAKIGWRPAQDEIGATYWVLRQQWKKCVEIGAPAVEPLIVALSDWERQKAAAGALAQIGVPAVEPLIAVLKDRDSYRLSYAASALGQIGDTRAVEPIIAALNDDENDRSVLEAAIDALERFGEARAVEALIAALKKSNTLVRKAAARSLVKLYQSRSLSATQKQLILDQRGCMSEAHTDVTSEPCRSSGIHTDKGIGVAFPI
jgi:HEAT repeat protein